MATETRLNSERACAVSVTREGNRLIERIGSRVKTRSGRIDYITLKKYAQEGFLTFNSLSDAFFHAFKNYDTVIAVMATGIVVRMIAPLLESKVTDPGVIVTDVCGKNVISFLSGHLGNANENTTILAGALRSNPVITTASDTLGKNSLERIVEILDARILDYKNSKVLASALLENKDIAIISNLALPEEIYKLPHVTVLEDFQEDFSGYIFTSADSPKLYNSITVIPRDIVLGIGSKKEISSETVLKVIRESLHQYHIDPLRIKAFATISKKKEEPGIVEAAKVLDTKVEIIENKKIEEVEHRFTQSEFVKKTVGVGNVAESCGYLASNQGRQIGEKIKKQGVTLSIWQKKTGA